MEVLGEASGVGGYASGLHIPLGVILGCLIQHLCTVRPRADPDTRYWTAAACFQDWLPDLGLPSRSSWGSWLPLRLRVT